MGIALTILAGLITFLISFLGTPFVRMFAIRFGVFATSDNRTIHRRRIPNLGGLTIAVGFASGLVILGLNDLPSQTLGLLWGGALVTLLGFYDDVRVLGSYRKLIGQVVAALLAVLHGFTIEVISLPFGGALELGVFSLVFSVLWIVALINAMNLLDGLDGLASVTGILIAAFLAISAILANNVETAIFAGLLFLALSGFLKYNLPPARIFMGDTGSLFLGFVLACLSLRAFSADSTVFHFPMIIVLFTVPLLDTTLAIVRRLAQRQHPFAADKKHIHHRLLEMGLNQRSAVLVLSGITAVCGLVVICLLNSNSVQTIAWLSALGFVMFLFLNQLESFDFLSKRRSPTRGVFPLFKNRRSDKAALNNNVSPRDYVSSSFRSSATRQKPLPKAEFKTKS